MPKLPAALLLALLLTACAAPQTAMLTPSRSYLPLVVSSVTETGFFTVEEVPFATIADKHRAGDGLTVAVNWAKVLRDGWGEVDAKVGAFRGPLSLVIFGAPSQVTLGATCLPVLEYAWPAFADFVARAIMRYQNTVMVQIGNEPDTADTSLEWWLGCWGDTYADGQHFGEFYNYVYGKLKPSYQGVTIIAGGYASVFDAFSHGALATVQGDGNGVHYYWWCSGVADPQSVLAHVQARSPYPVHLTETSMLYSDPNNVTCRNKQAAYLAQEFSMAGFASVTHYNFGCRPDGYEWHNSGIYGEDCEWKPAVDVYQGR